MQTTQSRISNLALAVLGFVAAALVIAVLANARLPMLASPRSAFLALAIIGCVMCPLGMRIETYGWLNPFNVLGIVIGSLITLLILAVLLGIQLPWIADDRAAIIALAALMIVKVILAWIRAIVHHPSRATA